MKDSVISADVSLPGETAHFARRRATIDIIATSRARAIRAALFGSYLFRTNPNHREDEGTRAGWRRVLKEQADALARAAELVNGRDPNGTVPRDVCTWIGSHGAQRQTHAKAFAKMSALTDDVVKAADTNDLHLLEAALLNHLTFGRGGFFESVTEFCDALWADLDTQRHKEVEKATAAADAIGNTLVRLEHIGKHVRLVSLNASVEAARVGDAGRGLGVIAVEFKTLAEEIQRLATTARADIAEMSQKVTRGDSDPFESHS